MPAVSTEPTTGALLVHVPPATESDNAMSEPAHKMPDPAISDGKLITVTTVVAGGQPNALYEMVVVPPLSPETIPVVPTEPTSGALLVQEPPSVASAKLISEP